MRYKGQYKAKQSVKIVCIYHIYGVQRKIAEGKKKKKNKTVNWQGLGIL